MRRVHAFAQGVFYRANTEKEARALGLVGWVRNLRDGRVEVVAEGPQDKLELLVAWMRRGPPNAVVTGVQSEFGEAKGEFASFSVTK